MRKTSKWKTGKRPRSEPLAKAPLGAKLNFSGFLTRKKIIVEASPVGGVDGKDFAELLVRVA